MDSKCNSCGSSFKFVPQLQKLKCIRCASVKNILSKKLITKEDYFTQKNVKKNKQLGAAFKCNNCGAEANVNDKVISGMCAYCGSHNILQLKSSIEYIPHGIVPFKISKSMAVEQYKNWVSKRKFAPTNLKKIAKIKEMEGIYLPCWNFDFVVHSKIKGVGINEHRTVMGGNSQTTYTTTRHYFSGKRKDEFLDYPHVANKTISQYEFLKLGNYGLYNLKVFNEEYLLGFVSSGYDIKLSEAFQYAKNEAEKEIVENAKQQFRYDKYASFECDSKFESVMWQYMYLPIWVCNFKYSQKNYRFLVNGYSGHTIGSAPRSPWKILRFVATLLLGAAVIAGIVHLM